MLGNLEYDYPTLEIGKFDNRLVDFIDQNFDPSKEEDRLKAIQLVKEKGYSDEFISRICEHYGEEFIVPARPGGSAMGHYREAVPEHTGFRTFCAARSMAKPYVAYENSIITKGVCADFSEFIKNICGDLQIPCKTINGATPVAHVWNMIDLGDGFKHYDITYALYARDRYNNWDKTPPNTWFGISNETLLHLHTTRKIDTLTPDTTISKNV